MNLDVQHIKRWMVCTNEKIQKNQQYLSQLDQAIGDGDHGKNMARGFNEVVLKINAIDYQTISDLMRDVAMTIMVKVGGAAGPLYGTAFLKLSIAWKDKEIINHLTLSQGLRAAVNGIKQRGQAARGQKTLIDVWVAVMQYLEEVEQVEINKMRLIAKEGMEKTKEMVGTKGRAAYFKEYSLGHIDPGAMSSYYLFESLCDVLEEDEKWQA